MKKSFAGVFGLGVFVCGLTIFAAPAFADFFQTFETVGRVAGAVAGAQNDVAAGRPVDLGRASQALGRGGKHGGGGRHGGHHK